ATAEAAGLFPTIPTEIFSAPPPEPAPADLGPPPDLEAFAVATENRIRPHQGGLILALGISSIGSSLLGLLGGCPLLYFMLVFALAGMGIGLPVWFKGSSDLRKMKTNLVDPAGQGQTQTGRILGLVGGIIGGIGLMIGFISIVAAKVIEMQS